MKTDIYCIQVTKFESETADCFKHSSHVCWVSALCVCRVTAINNIKSFLNCNKLLTRALFNI